MPEYNVALGNAVKKARDDLGLTQSEVAFRAHVDTRTVLNIENSRGNPKLEVLYSLIRTLEIDPNEIFYHERQEIAPATRRMQLLVERCTDEEAQVLYPACLSILEVLRSHNKNEIE